MKNLKSLIVVLAIVLTSQSFAGNNNDNGGNKLFSKKIQKVLSAAKVVKSSGGKSEKVTVNFVVNENGDVTEACANANNKDAKQYIEKQFMTLNLKGLQPCVTNTVDVTFINY